MVYHSYVIGVIDEDVVCWLFAFYGISTFVGYLMPNPYYKIISSISNNSV